MMPNYFSDAADALGKVRELVINGDKLTKDLEMLVEKAGELTPAAIRIETAASFAADRIKTETTALTNVLHLSTAAINKESKSLQDATQEISSAKSQFVKGVEEVSSAHKEIVKARNETLQAKQAVLELKSAIESKVAALVTSVVLLFVIAIGAVVFAVTR